MVLVVFSKAKGNLKTDLAKVYQLLPEDGIKLVWRTNIMILTPNKGKSRLVGSNAVCKSIIIMYQYLVGIFAQVNFDNKVRKKQACNE